MEEQMLSSDSENLDIETIRSRIGDLTEIIRSSKDTSEESSSPELKILLEIFSSKIEQVGFRDFDSLRPEDLDAYLKEAQEQLNVAEVENTAIYNEIEVLRRTYIQDSIQLEKDFEELNFSLKHLDAQDLNKSELGPNVDISTLSSGNLVHQQEDYNFEGVITEATVGKTDDYTYTLVDMVDSSENGIDNAPCEDLRSDEEGETSVASQEQLKKEHTVYENFIMGRLTNLGSMSLDDCYSMFKSRCSYDKSLQELQIFLSVFVSEEKLEFRDGMYSLRRR